MSDIKDRPVPGFCLKADDSQKLWELLEHYEPYSNGTTAVFWHIVGIIGNHKEKLL
jgi:hypothetical protein